VDETKDFDPDGHAGYLAPIASKILMKVLYAARMARFDLLRATAFLACSGLRSMIVDCIA
jgi:hypothetical protein